MSYQTVAICAFGVFFFYFYYGIQQEKIFRSKHGNPGSEERFDFVMTALFLQSLCSCIVSFCSLKLYAEKADDVFRKGQFPVLSAAYLGAMFCSNWALKYVNYPTQVIGKSCKPIPIMITGFLFANKKYTLQKYLFIALIVVGVVIFSYKDSKSSSKSMNFSFGSGELLLLLSLAQDGAVATIQDRMKAVKRPSSYGMMFAMNLWSSLFSLIAALAINELKPFVDFIVRNGAVATDLALLCGCSVMGQVFIFKSVTELSPLACSIITTTRKCFTVLASVLLFGNTLTVRQWGGVVLVFSGLFLDNFFAGKKKSS